jgi:hypothetical protein
MKKIPEKAAAQFRQMNQQIVNFLSGIRLGMEIPDDWVFDTNQMVFVPPAPKEEPPKEE